MKDHPYQIGYDTQAKEARTSNRPLTRNSPEAYLVTREMLWAEVERLTAELAEFKKDYMDTAALLGREEALHKNCLELYRRSVEDGDRLRAALDHIRETVRQFPCRHSDSERLVWCACCRTKDGLDLAGQPSETTAVRPNIGWIPFHAKKGYDHDAVVYREEDCGDLNDGWKWIALYAGDPQ